MLSLMKDFGFARHRDPDPSVVEVILDLRPPEGA